MTHNLSPGPSPVGRTAPVTVTGGAGANTATELAICPAADLLAILRAVVHCDWLHCDERVELAQELTTAADLAESARILSRWNVDFNGALLVDLTGEIV